MDDRFRRHRRGLALLAGVAATIAMFAVAPAATASARESSSPTVYVQQVDSGAQPASQSSDWVW